MVCGGLEGQEMEAREGEGHKAERRDAFAFIMLLYANIPGRLFSFKAYLGMGIGSICHVLLSFLLFATAMYLA